MERSDGPTHAEWSSRLYSSDGLVRLVSPLISKLQEKWGDTLVSVAPLRLGNLGRARKSVRAEKVANVLIFFDSARSEYSPLVGVGVEGHMVVHKLPDLVVAGL